MLWGRADVFKGFLVAAAFEVMEEFRWKSGTAEFGGGVQLGERGGEGHGRGLQARFDDAGERSLKIGDFHE